MRMCRRIFQRGGGSDANVINLAGYSSKTIKLTQPSGVLFVLTRDESKTGPSAGGYFILDYEKSAAENVYGGNLQVSITTSANSYNFTITNITNDIVDLMLLE